MSRTTDSQITDDVMRKIQAGDIKMKPRFYFSLLTVIAATLIAVSGFLLAYLMSIVYFWVRIQTASSMAYGARRNLNESLTDFPYWLVVISAILAILSIWLIRRQSRMYRHHIFTIAVVFIASSLFTSVIFNWAGVGKPYAQRHAAGSTSSQVHYQPGWRHQSE